MPDHFESENGLDPLDASDAAGDIDSDGVNNFTEYLNQTDPTVDDYPPILQVPNNVSVIATGPLTVVDLGVARASDSNDGVITPLVDNSGPFVPGVTTVNWSATDAAGNKTTGQQSISVTPLMSLSATTPLVEGNEGQIQVSLNGEAVTYPVQVELSVTGTAVVTEDHNLIDQSVILQQGTQALIGFTTVDDGVGEGNERIEIELGSVLNASLGSPTRISLMLTEENIPPQVSLSVYQDGEPRSTIVGNGGLVTVTAGVIDQNIDDVHYVDWSMTDNRLSRLGDTSDASFVFDPAGLLKGSYEVRVNVTDNGVNPLTTNVSTSVFLLPEAEFLSDTADSDADGISDADEGYVDSDGDRIPDYLDSSDQPDLLPSILNGFVLQTSGGASLRLGNAAVNAESSGAEISMIEVEDYADDLGVVGGDIYYFTRGIFDFEIYGISAGSQASVVIPQLAAIPAEAVYRKFSRALGWQNFVEDERNSLKSAPGDLGICPAPNSDVYQEGLGQGHFCLQLDIEEGGPNDTDSETNAVIKDPGGVATLAIPPPDVVLETRELSDSSFEEGDGNSVVLAFSFVSDSYDVELSGLSFIAAGTLDDASEILGANLYLDGNGDGVISEGDDLIGEGRFDENDGTLEFKLGEYLVLPRGRTSLLVSYEL
jgi:hypothetical protein